jgi:hypothetical protein
LTLKQFVQRNLNSQEGFSVLMLICMVSIIASAMAVGLMRESESTLVALKVSRTMKTEFNDLTAELYIVLSSYDSCKAGLHYSLLPTADTPSVPVSLTYPDGRSLATAGGRYGRLQIQSIDLLREPDVDTSTLAAGRLYDLYKLRVAVLFSGSTGVRTRHVKDLMLWIYQDGSGGLQACRSTAALKYPLVPVPTSGPLFTYTSVEQHTCASTSNFNTCMECKTNGMPYSWCMSCVSIGSVYDSTTQSCKP